MQTTVICIWDSP